MAKKTNLPEVVPAPTIDLDLKISKKEMIDMMIEEHELGLQQEHEGYIKDTAALAKSLQLNQSQKKLIAKELANNKDVKKIITLSDLIVKTINTFDKSNRLDKKKQCEV